MSIRPSVVWSARRLFRNDPCIFCAYGNVQPIRRYAGLAGNEAEKRNRHAFYRLLQADRLLPVKLDDANHVLGKFVANKERNMKPADNVRRLAAEYKVKVVHIAYLAIPLFRLDVKSQRLAAAMLLACSAAKDLTSTLQILNAIYYSSNGYRISQATDIARLFTPGDIDTCKSMLRQLAEEGDAHAMTLHGRFLELVGQKQGAICYYENALEKYDTKIHYNYPHPMALPWLTPWTCLVDLQQADKTPESIAKMKKALEFGALKADDPLAYYRLASFEKTKSPEWLAYMSKAAASGHSEAMYKLGQFYLDVSMRPSAFLGDGKFRTALRFMTSWKRNGAADFAMEWFKAAAMGGHKPALFEMAELYKGDKEGVKSCLRAVLKEPPKGKQEEWPHLVMQARQQLAAM